MTVYLCWRAFTTNWIYSTFGELILRLAWTINAWAGICIMVPHFFSAELQYFVLGLIFTGPICLFLAFYYTKRQNMTLLTGQPELLKDEEDCLRFCIELYRLTIDIKEGSKEATYLLSSYVAYQKHSKRAGVSVPVGAVEDDKKKNEKTKQIDRDMRSMLYILNRHVKAQSVRHPTSVALKIFYIGFLLNDTKNYSLSWALAEQASRLYCSWSELFVLYCIK